MTNQETGAELRTGEQAGHVEETKPVAAPEEQADEGEETEQVAEADEEAAELSEEQQRSLELLAAGKSVSATAREAGVGRTTLYRWMNDDPDFIAAFNQWRQQLVQMGRARMLALMDKAVDAVERSLDAGDGKLGARLLEVMGIAKEPEIGPTDAEDVEVQQELVAIRRMREERRERAGERS